MKLDPNGHRKNVRSMIIVSRNVRCSGYSLGLLGEGASSDSGVADSVIFMFVTGYVFGNFRRDMQDTG